MIFFFIVLDLFAKFPKKPSKNHKSLDFLICTNINILFNEVCLFVMTYAKVTLVCTHRCIHTSMVAPKYFVVDTTSQYCNSPKVPRV